MEEIDPRNLLKKIAQIFDKLNISYLITGGMAVLLWGRPRFTADIDIVVEMKLSDADSVLKISGANLDMKYIHECVSKLNLENEFKELINLV